MTHSKSPLELTLIPLFLAAAIGTVVLWGSGIIVGSILDAGLPGDVGDGIVAMLSSFPDVGQAWDPAIPSWPVWSLAFLVLGAFAPLVWRVWRSAGQEDEGARWATAADLRRARLLIPDRPPSFMTEDTDEA